MSEVIVPKKLIRYSLDLEVINKIFTQDYFKLLLPGFIEHHTHRNDLAGKVTLLPLSRKENVEKEEETH